MSARVYVGNLPIDIKEREIDDLFYKYGRIREIDIKNQGRPPAFAFIVFDDYRDAEDAIRGRDGYMFDGARLRVEMARGGRDRDRRDRDDRSTRGKTGGKRTDFGVVVSGLPRSCSWQDLKDFMRKAGDVAFADVDKRGEGFVDYFSASDMDKAIETLDNTEFKNPYDTCTIRVRPASTSSSSKRDGSADRHDTRGRSHSKDSYRSRSRDGNGKRSSRSPSPRERSVSRDRRSPSPARGDRDD